jgi:hypothetical protein
MEFKYVMLSSSLSRKAHDWNYKSLFAFFVQDLKLQKMITVFIVKNLKSS